MNSNRGARAGLVTLMTLVLTLSVVGAASAQNAPWSNAPNQGSNNFGYGPGMMGQGYGPGPGNTGDDNGFGYGMMGPGYGGRGYGYGMMGQGYGGPGYGYGMPGSGYGDRRGDSDRRRDSDRGRPGYGPRNGQGRFDNSAQTGQRIDAQKVGPLVDTYLGSFPDGSKLEVAEIMEFQYNYYVQIRDKSSHALAFELLVNPYSGRIAPEPGPNMAWNTLYGHMAGISVATPPTMTVSPAQAVKLATDFVKRYSANSSVGKAEAFPGYYTLHIIDGGKIVGMLSVNGYTGRIWYHNWHGTYVKTITERD
ncbi:MAG TPA: hypothetical protein VMW87_05290 [Spirochaetia bacterium]|nr:hypothetical protein [Spirochaetia bacterium]